MSLKQMLDDELNEDVILTPHINKWLVDNSEEAWDDSVIETINGVLRTKPRNRTGSWSSSSAGYCPRRQIFDFVGQEPNAIISAKQFNLFNDGKWRHLRWQAMLLQAGLITDIEVSLDWPKMYSKGSMDGMGLTGKLPKKLKWQDKSFGFELKGMNPFQFKNLAELKKQGRMELPKKHLHQVNRYFLSSGLDLFIYIVEDKASQDWIEVVVEPDKKLIEANRQELELLNSHVTDKTLPEVRVECSVLADNEFKMCPYGEKKRESVCFTIHSWEDIRGRS